MGGLGWGEAVVVAAIVMMAKLRMKLNDKEWAMSNEYDER